MKLLDLAALELAGAQLPADADAERFARLVEVTVGTGAHRIPEGLLELAFAVPLASGEDADVRVIVPPATYVAIRWSPRTFRSDAAASVTVSPAILSDVRLRDLEALDLSAYLLAVLLCHETGGEARVDVRRLGRDLSHPNPGRLRDAFRRLAAPRWLELSEDNPSVVGAVVLRPGPRHFGEPVVTDELDEARSRLHRERAERNYAELERETFVVGGRRGRRR